MIDSGKPCGSTTDFGNRVRPEHGAGAGEEEALPKDGFVRRPTRALQVKSWSYSLGGEIMMWALCSPSAISHGSPGSAGRVGRPDDSPVAYGT